MTNVISVKSTFSSRDKVIESCGAALNIDLVFGDRL